MNKLICNENKICGVKMDDGRISYFEQEQTSRMPNPRSKYLAGILGITLGGFGAHNWYLKKEGRALVQVVALFGAIIFLGGGFPLPTSVAFLIGSLWGIIEGLLIVTSKAGTRWNRDQWGRALVG